MRHRDDSKHKAILDATIQLITTEGIANISMSKIANDANVSPATIYIYFENKDDLLNKLYLAVTENFSRAIFKGLSESRPVKESAQLIWKNSRRYFLSNPIVFASLGQLTRSPLISKSSKEQGQSFFLPIVELIKRGQAEEILPNIAVAVQAAIIYSPLISLIEYHHRSDFVLTEELAMSTFERCWKAVQK